MSPLVGCSVRLIDELKSFKNLDSGIFFELGDIVSYPKVFNAMDGDLYFSSNPASVLRRNAYDFKKYATLTIRKLT